MSCLIVMSTGSRSSGDIAASTSRTSSAVNSRPCAPCMISDSRVRHPSIRIISLAVVCIYLETTILNLVASNLPGMADMRKFFNDGIMRRDAMRARP